MKTITQVKQDIADLIKECESMFVRTRIVQINKCTDGMFSKKAIAAYRSKVGLAVLKRQMELLNYIL